MHINRLGTSLLEEGSNGGYSAAKGCDKVATLKRRGPQVQLSAPKRPSSSLHGACIGSQTDPAPPTKRGSEGLFFTERSAATPRYTVLATMPTVHSTLNTVPQKSQKGPDLHKAKKCSLGKTERKEHPQVKSWNWNVKSGNASRVVLDAEKECQTLGTKSFAAASKLFSRALGRSGASRFAPCHQPETKHMKVEVDQVPQVR